MERSTILLSFSADHHSSSIKGIANGGTDGACVPATLRASIARWRSYTNTTHAHAINNLYYTLINSFLLFGSVWTERTLFDVCYYVTLRYLEEHMTVCSLAWLSSQVTSLPIIHSSSTATCENNKSRLSRISKITT